MTENKPKRLLSWILSRLVRGLFALPDSLLRKVFGDPPSEAAELSMDSWALARLTAKSGGSDRVYEVESARQETEFLAGIVCLPVPEVITQEWILEGDGRSLNARLFIPKESPMAGPLLIHFHGGGWVQGSLDSHAGACAWHAREAGVRVLSVDYRLAPEHPFPAQAEDALLAWRSVMADPSRFGADPGRVGVLGDSAGAHIAAVLCQDLKASGEPQPACQVLIYPVTSCSGTTPSKETFASGYYLTTNRMDWFEECFLHGGDPRDPRVSPLLAKDLSGLAPAVVSVSAVDPLRDEGIAYAERLQEARVPTELDEMPLLHSWFNLTASRSSREGHKVLARRVNELLG